MNAKIEKILSDFSKDDAIRAEKYITRAGWYTRLANKLKKAGMTHNEALSMANNHGIKLRPQA
jgi:hypothetical protein